MNVVLMKSAEIRSVVVINMEMNADGRLYRLHVFLLESSDAQERF
jgi:hypothetical protein